MTQLADVEKILDANRYLVLATATPDGTPWATPVYFAHDEPTTFWWVSHPDARHSRNIAVNPAVAITVFDATVPFGGASGVYAGASAQECTDDLVGEGIAVFDRCSRRDDAGSWDAGRVTGDARLRLYRARVTSLFLLATDDGPERRIPVAIPPRVPGP
jgi:hypothetical protein